MTARLGKGGFALGAIPAVLVAGHARSLQPQSTLTSNTYGHVLEQRQQEMARGMDTVLGG